MGIRPGNHNPRPLMKQLAAMANMDFARIRRMVLVLDVDDSPRLFVESFLCKSEGGSEPKLEQTELEVVEEPLSIDTTSMQNDRYRTAHLREKE